MPARSCSSDGEADPCFGEPRSGGCPSRADRPRPRRGPGGSRRRCGHWRRAPAGNRRQGSKPRSRAAVVVGGRSPAPAMARGSPKSYSLAEGPRAPMARGVGESAAVGQTRGRFLGNRAAARGPQTHRRGVRSEHRERRAKGRTGGAVQAPSKAAPAGGRPGLPPQAACGFAPGKGLRSGHRPRRPSAT